MDCSLPGSSVHGISQAGILEWVASSPSRGSSQLRDWSRISCTGKQMLYHWATREALRGPGTQLTGALVAGCPPKSVLLLPASSQARVGGQLPDQGILPTLMASCHRVTGSQQWKVTEVICNVRQYQTQCLEPRFSSPGSPFPVCSLDSDDQAKYKPSPRLSTRRRSTCWSEITWTIHRGGRNFRQASSPVCHHRPNGCKRRKDSSRPTWRLGSWCRVAPWAQHGQ